MATETEPWVFEIFLRKLLDRAGEGFGSHQFWDNMDNSTLDRYLAIIERLPDKAAFVEDQRPALESQLNDADKRTPEQIERLKKLLGHEDEVEC